MLNGWREDAWHLYLPSGKLLLTLTDIFDIRAEIIKVEHPTRGDDTRAWGPPYAKYNAESDRKGPGESAYFIGVSFLPP